MSLAFWGIGLLEGLLPGCQVLCNLVAVPQVSTAAYWDSPSRSVNQQIGGSQIE